MKKRLVGFLLILTLALSLSLIIEASPGDGIVPPPPGAGFRPPGQLNSIILIEADSSFELE